MENKIRYAFVEGVIPGIGPDGHMQPIQPGVYLVAELDGMTEGIVMLRPGKEKTGDLMAKVQESTISVMEVLDTAHSYEWAMYYWQHPGSTRSIGEQLGRRPFWNTVTEN